jgi:hypothetical protein
MCCLTSLSKSESKCWKIFGMIFFGLTVTGFPFGGLGFGYLCQIYQDRSYQFTIDFKWFYDPTFLEIIVYSYFAFIVFYMILIPMLTFSHS